MSELADVIVRLYGQLPGEFVAARNDEASRAKQAGDDELAAEIKALRKPSASAWALNLVARREPDQLDEVLQIGAELRAATEARAGEQLRRLSRERHQAIAAVTVTAGRLAAAAGARLTEAAGRDVAATLDAAVADEGAAAAVRSGCLVRALVPSGFDAVDLDGAVADPGSAPLVIARPRLHTVAPTDGSGTGSDPGSGKPGPRQVAVDDARNLAALAERGLVRADSARVSAEGRAEAGRARVAEAQRALEVATAELTGLEHALAQADAVRDAARRKRDDAQKALRRAEAANR